MNEHERQKALDFLYKKKEYLLKDLEAVEILLAMLIEDYKKTEYEMKDGKNPIS